MEYVAPDARFDVQCGGTFGAARTPIASSIKNLSPVTTLQEYGAGLAFPKHCRAPEFQDLLWINSQKDPVSIKLLHAVEFDAFAGLSKCSGTYT